MSLQAKQILIAVLGVLFLASLVFVQWKEIDRRRQESGETRHITIPVSSKRCYDCHKQGTPGITAHWHDSTHAAKGVGCVECHQAEEGDIDAFMHEGQLIATIVTPRDCGRCHKTEYEEFTHSHHARAGNILDSLDNILAETVEGHKEPFNPHSPTFGMDIKKVNGLASVNVGCKQCHGSIVALESKNGGLITVKELDPDENGKPRNKSAVEMVKFEKGRPVLAASSWPNTGIGRINLDGSRGSCSACHSRHDFSPRRARQPENCGKCHLGPDHPQKEIYEESKHGVAYRDLREKMNLDHKTWVLGEDYSQAPTCATCHMSANTLDRKVTHDPGTRISWTNRPPISRVMDTNLEGDAVTETDPSKRPGLIVSVEEAKEEPDPKKRKRLIVDTWQNKRARMTNVCKHCHTDNYISAFYKQYDDFVINYNEKFAKPGSKIMASLLKNGLRTKADFDEKIEWTWFYLWHHEGRRARHGASMMAPDYAHWHGMYEVAERFYQELIPEALEIAEHARKEGKIAEADNVLALIDKLLARPEHAWFEAAKKAGKVDAKKAGKEDAKKKVAAKKAEADGPAKEEEKEDKKDDDAAEKKEP